MSSYTKCLLYITFSNWCIEALHGQPLSGRSTRSRRVIKKLMHECDAREIHVRKYSNSQDAREATSRRAATPTRAHVREARTRDLTRSKSAIGK